MICITIHLDGKTSGCDYKYIVTKDSMAWTAFRSDNGFRRFMKLHGLKINPKCTQVHDMRHIGAGRCITTACYNKQVDDRNYFYSLSDIPEGATKFIGLCNGSYVDCYILDSGDKVSVYRPNPNANEVYKPYNYHEMSNKYC